MGQVFRLQVHPAQRGDALWIEYGDEKRIFHILIDGGITATARDSIRKKLDAYTETGLHIELLVVTHIDVDHIQGVIHLFENLPEGVTIGDVWFNGWEQLRFDEKFERLGVPDGIRLSEILNEKYGQAWNKAVGGAAVALGGGDEVVHLRLSGGMEISVLGPRRQQLRKLHQHWAEVVRELKEAEEQPVVDDDGEPLKFERMGPAVIDVAALAMTKFSEDRGIPNGSSIALSLSYSGQTVLMLGDAHPSTIVRSLRQLAPKGRFQATAVKLSHHGSRNNTDQDLVAMISARKWIFSSNGANNTKHPHQEAVARVLAFKDCDGELLFNYKTKFNSLWDNDDLKAEHGYQTLYGSGDAPIEIDLMAREAEQ